MFPRFGMEPCLLPAVLCIQVPHQIKRNAKAPEEHLLPQNNPELKKKEKRERQLSRFFTLNRAATKHQNQRMNILMHFYLFFNKQALVCFWSKVMPVVCEREPKALHAWPVFLPSRGPCLGLLPSFVLKKPKVYVKTADAGKVHLAQSLPVQFKSKQGFEPKCPPNQPSFTSTLSGSKSVATSPYHISRGTIYHCECGRVQSFNSGTPHSLF